MYYSGYNNDYSDIKTEEGKSLSYISPDSPYYEKIKKNHILKRSIDSSKTWELIYEDRGDVYSSLDLVIDPNNPDILFIAGPNGLKESLDKGDSWINILDEPCREIYISKSNNYFVLTDNNLNISHDSGKTWKRNILKNSKDYGRFRTMKVVEDGVIIYIITNKGILKIR
ncbi:hypothetical protein ACFL6G_08585 [candidate division KSB1 bacterium]